MVSDIWNSFCAGWHLKGWNSTSFKKLICIKGNTVNLHTHIILLFALITFPHSHNPLCMRLIQALYEINTWQIHFNSSIRSHCKNHLLLKILELSINRRKNNYRHWELPWDIGITSCLVIFRSMSLADISNSITLYSYYRRKCDKSPIHEKEIRATILRELEMFT